MPTYEYACTKCQHRWEAFAMMSAKPQTLCPACGKKSAKRLIGTGSAIVFKGSGFYQTDYRSESYKKAEQAEKKPEVSAPSAGTSPPPASPATPAPTSPSPSKRPGKKKA